MVVDNFFETKITNVSSIQKCQGMLQLPIYKWFKQLGVSEDILSNINGAAIA